MQINYFIKLIGAALADWQSLPGCRGWAVLQALCMLAGGACGRGARAAGCPEEGAEPASEDAGEEAEAEEEPKPEITVWKLVTSASCYPIQRCISSWK